MGSAGSIRTVTGEGSLRAADCARLTQRPRERSTLLADPDQGLALLAAGERQRTEQVAPSSLEGGEGLDRRRRGCR